MKHPETHKVTLENGPRPAGRPDYCFYCNEPIGNDHRPDCVCRKRTIVLELKTEVVIDVPEHWHESMIDFYYNESSHCTDNLLQLLVKRYSLTGDGEPGPYPCSCGNSECRYVGEASEQDDQEWELTEIKP